MWKCLSRSLRKTLKNSVLRCNTVLSTTAPQNREVQSILKLTPTFVERSNRSYKVYKENCEQFYKEKKDREGPKEKRTSFLGGLENYFVDALTWSGALVLAAYYTVYYKQKRLFHFSNFFEKNARCPDLIRYHKTLRYFFDSVGVKSYNCVIPEVQAAISASGSQQFPETESFKSNEFSNEENYSSLERAHQKVLGALSNWLGVQCINSGQHKEAFEYFLQSAGEEHASGLFNLGICHEKGYGTTQNHEKAAELYQRAANLGHATAMYNLGVFYSQGLGGIQPNMNHARALFKEAAGLGQLDAAKALNLEKQLTHDSGENALVSKNAEKRKNTLSQLIFDNLLDQSSSNSLDHFNACDDVKSCCDPFDYPQGKEMNSSFGSDSGVVDLSSPNELYVLIV